RLKSRIRKNPPSGLCFFPILQKENPYLGFMNVFPKRFRWLRWIMVSCVVFALGATTADYFDIAKNMDIFGKVYTEVNKVYVDETDPTKLMRIAIDSMLHDLDPYTRYFSESQVDASKLINTGEYSSIGAEIGVRNDKYLILQLFEKGPADKAGVQVGDEIVKVGEIDVQQADLELDAVNNLIMGQKGTEVSLLLRRSSQSELVSLAVSRGPTNEVAQENVPYSGMINDDLGYIMLTGFTRNAGNEVATAMKELRKKAPEIKGVILDLRGNPGGLLIEAVNIVNVFVPQGTKIVEMRGRTQRTQQSFSTRVAPVEPDLLVAVIVNSSSASASEIVSGAIQDLDRGVVVGQRSFGKGLVQEPKPLSFNTQMNITLAKYYTPSGRCIQAIDYSNRNPDGSVGKVPDSLVSSFTTKNGRKVFDGGGIDPDIKVAKPKLQPVSRALLDQGLIFDFVTQYSQEHDSIAAPRDFRLTDDIYNQFTNFVEGRDFSFGTKSEKQLNDLTNAIENGKYHDELLGEIEQIRQKLQQLKGQDLTTHKKEILPLLKKELITRYHYKQGVIEASFEDDPDVLAAISVLNDTSRFHAILRTDQ
ncbi:MAG: S41 family peptidase, partial [Bacteroidota bacterium]